MSVGRAFVCLVRGASGRCLVANRDDDLDLDRRAERESRDAHCGARVATRVAEDLDHER